MKNIKQTEEQNIEEKIEEYTHSDNVDRILFNEEQDLIIDRLNKKGVSNYTFESIEMNGVYGTFIDLRTSDVELYIEDFSGLMLDSFKRFDVNRLVFERNGKVIGIQLTSLQTLLGRIAHEIITEVAATGKVYENIKWADEKIGTNCIKNEDEEIIKERFESVKEAFVDFETISKTIQLLETQQVAAERFNYYQNDFKEE